MATTVKTGKEILSEFFDNFDIEYVFGNPGTTETTFLDVVSQKDNCKFILGLHESTATGIAVGYAAKSGRPSVVNIHTYPGLANAMSVLYNAYTVGIPLLVIAGQQNRNHLIHHPILSGNLTGLASSASVSQYQIDHISDMSTILQRSYLDADEAKAPAFISIPMDIYQDQTTISHFKPTKAPCPTVAVNLEPAAELIRNEKGGIVIVADAEAAWSDGLSKSLRLLSEGLHADVYLAPFSLRSMVDIRSPNYRGVLPAVSSEANETLSRYGTVVLLGEKIQSFLFMNKPTIPDQLVLIQFSNGNTRLRYDYSFDLVVRGDIASNLSRLCSIINLPTAVLADKKQACRKNPSLLVNLLECIARDTPIVIEGSSHQSVEEAITTELEFDDIYYEPRGGALGMAMPMAVGISLYSKKHSVCLLGDGGSMYSIHSIWTAAHYKIPVIFICIVNNEYQILKQLWKLQVPESDEKRYKPIMDIKSPELDLHKIASGFGARVQHATGDNFRQILNDAMQYEGPTFITITDDHRYA